MTRKKGIIGFMVFFLLIVVNIYVLNSKNTVDENIELTVEVQAQQEFSCQIYYLTIGQDYENGFINTQVVSSEYENKGNMQELRFSIPNNTSFIRLDLGERAQELTIGNIKIEYKDQLILEMNISEAIGSNMILSFEAQEENWSIMTQKGDPYFAFDIDVDSVLSYMESALYFKWLVKKILMCLALDVITLIAWLKWDIFVDIPKEIIRNRGLILKLSLNDFKTRFSGSIFGVVWAFVSPIVTVLLYWFVFQKALNVGTQSTKAGLTVPYILWLIAGLVPWFYFSEAWSSGTNALIEYSYLVKKVVFNISALPVVKIISSLFVHLFFIAFSIILYCCYQYYPNLYMLQIIYYSFCMIVFTTGLTYVTSAIVVFFRDLSQIIGIMMQVLMWMTPILWNIDGMNLNPVVSGILKMNPMYYIVSGYRDSLINQVWFWERLDVTVYFWVVSIALLGVGLSIFKKLQVHFADVL